MAGGAGVRRKEDRWAVVREGRTGRLSVKRSARRGTRTDDVSGEREGVVLRPIRNGDALEDGHGWTVEAENVHAVRFRLYNGKGEEEESVLLSAEDAQALWKKGCRLERDDPYFCASNFMDKCKDRRDK